MLLDEKARLAIHDPKALPNAKNDLSGVAETAEIEYCEDPYECAKGAHAVLILTEWRSFKELDYKRIFDSMEKPAFVFDGRNILDHAALFDIGFNVFPLGAPAMTRM
jgi:UDPglucose 6-dehydrogenase